MTLTFHILLESWGTPTSISEVYTDEEYYTTPHEDLPSNRVHDIVTVSDREAMQQWLAAKNTWLEAAWTPNQHDDHHGTVDPYEVLEQNRRIRRECEEIMSSLENNCIGEK